jgi:hypothetical protein
MSSKEIQCENCNTNQDNLEIRLLYRGLFISYYSVECNICKHIFEIKISH